MYMYTATVTELWSLEFGVPVDCGILYFMHGVMGTVTYTCLRATRDDGHIYTLILIPIHVYARARTNEIIHSLPPTVAFVKLAAKASVAEPFPGWLISHWLQLVKIVIYLIRLRAHTHFSPPRWNL